MTAFRGSLEAMSTIVLVPGAGLGGWVFSRIAPALRAAGHDVHPLTLTGTGDRAHLRTPEIDVSLWATDVLAHLEAEELGEVVLVGHSFGALPAMLAAARAPERIAHLVSLEGVPPVRGTSAFGAMGPEFEEVITGLVEAHDGWSLPWFTDEQLDTYYGDHGLTPGDLTWMRRHVTPQPIATLREVVTIGPLDGMGRTYVSCDATPGAGRAPEGWEHATLPTGHWPMVSAPAATAALLAQVVASR